MPRFAILTHDWPELHWDLLVEKEAGLRTWRLQSSPDQSGPIPAIPLADHRKEYLDYQGPVSGNRGNVSRWDGGKLTWMVEAPDEVRVRLEGTRLRGEARLTTTAPDQKGKQSGRLDTGNWEFVFVPDPASS